MTPESDYKLIPLTQEQVAIVDADDFASLNRWKWFAHWCPGTRSYYARRSVKTSDTILAILMAREIMGLNLGDKRQVDHINHDTLDNRRSNLRIVSAAENSINRRMRSDNKSGHKGVTWEKERCKWRVRIKRNERNINLGRFIDLNDAVKAYENAARELHGEFLCLNG
jgi:hypothetical protein